MSSTFFLRALLIQALWHVSWESVIVGCHENLHAILHHRGFYRNWIRTPCHNPSPAQPYSMEVFVQVYSTRNFTTRKICFPQSKLVCLKCDAYKCGHAVPGLPATMPLHWLMAGPDAVTGLPSGLRLPLCNCEWCSLKCLALFSLSSCLFTFKTPATVCCFNW